MGRSARRAAVIAAVAAGLLLGANPVDAAKPARRPKGLIATSIRDMAVRPVAGVASAEFESRLLEVATGKGVAGKRVFVRATDLLGAESLVCIAESDATGLAVCQPPTTSGVVEAVETEASRITFSFDGDNAYAATASYLCGAVFTAVQPCLPPS